MCDPQKWFLYKKLEIGQIDGMQFVVQFEGNNAKILLKVPKIIPEKHIQTEVNLQFKMQSIDNE